MRGGRKDLTEDPHAYVIENIMREDQATQAFQDKQKQNQQDQHLNADVVLSKHPPLKDVIPAEDQSKQRLATISQYYKKYNFPALERLYELIKKVEPQMNISRKEIKGFLQSQTQEQIFRQQMTKSIHKSGHITALYPFEVIQLDIVFMLNYQYVNKAMPKQAPYFLIGVDVFTRKAFAQPLKTKEFESVGPAFMHLVKYDMDGTFPKVIMSDNDSTFLGKEFSNLCKINDVVLHPSIVEDHHFTGIVDNMCKRLKLTFAKLFVMNKNVNWVDYLQTVIDNYNETPNSAIDDLSPNECLLKENFNNILDINLLKSLKNRTVSDLRMGDWVREKVGGKFTKSSEPQWSEQVYKVIEVNGNDITLQSMRDDRSVVVRRNNLLKIENYQEPIKLEDEEEAKEDEPATGPIMEAIHNTSVNRKLNQEGIARNDDEQTLTEAIKTGRVRATVQKEEEDPLLHQFIRKKFKTKYFYGIVLSYDKPYYKVAYEDDDEEELSKTEVKKLLWTKPVPDSQLQKLNSLL